MTPRPACRSFLSRVLVGALLLAFALPRAGAAEPPAPLSVPRAMPEIVPLWTGPAPGEAAALEKPEAAVLGDDQVLRVSHVAVPDLRVFLPPAGARTGCAVLVCPGGGYSILAMDKEGTEVAAWLNGIGVTAVLLKYRVPARPGQPRHLAPAQDMQRAISLVRSRAAEWEIDPARIGILGFSAGGHAAAVTSTRSATRLYEARDAADATPCRPDFSVLVYPAYLVKDDVLNPEVVPLAGAPPAFVVYAGDDRLGPENGIAYYLALQRLEIPAELHVYASGGHGFGLRPSAHAAATWPDRCRDWMRGLGLIPR